MTDNLQQLKNDIISTIKFYNYIWALEDFKKCETIKDIIEFADNLYNITLKNDIYHLCSMHKFHPNKIRYEK